MKTIMVLDSKDYQMTKRTVSKVTVRAVIEENGKLLLQRDGAGVYKLPGGGTEGEETHLQTLKREVLEEVGRDILPDTLEEIGVINEMRRDIFNADVKFVRNTYFYKCQVGPQQHPLSLTDSERAAGFTAVWADVDEIIRVNLQHGLKDCMKRDTEFLEWLRRENNG